MGGEHDYGPPPLTPAEVEEAREAFAVELTKPEAFRLLLATAERKGYMKAWAHHRFREQFGEDPPCV